MEILIWYIIGGFTTGFGFATAVYWEDELDDGPTVVVITLISVIWPLTAVVTVLGAITYLLWKLWAKQLDKLKKRKS